MESGRDAAARLPGEVPEWLKGTDCKSVGLAYVGSNPTLSTSSGLRRDKPERLAKRKIPGILSDHGSRV
jgi:hypothetical protein